jgi:hypothetical protein
MMTLTFNPQEFYSTQGQISDPGPFADELALLPGDLPALIKTIQGLMVHLHWAERYGLFLDKTRKEEANIRTLHDRLNKIIELQQAPLTESRDLSKRTVGTCRDYALILAAILRLQGKPARARAGFGTYFTPGRFEDHWICEYWLAVENRWVVVDPQLDAFQMETLKISFDPLDMPRTKFVTGTEAWQRCRAKQVNPDRFGIFRMHGLDFVKGNLLRDFLALNKFEILPWDNYGPIRKPLRKMEAAEKDLMDRFAAVGTGEDRDFLLMRSAFIAHQHDLLPEYFFSNETS